MFERSGGILLHPTSLPGKFGIGDLGPSAYEFANFLSQTNTKLWQILPTCPTGYGDSPYSGLSAFAGNPLLISPEKLKEINLISDLELKTYPQFPKHRVDFGNVITCKWKLLRTSFDNFIDKTSNSSFNQFHDRFMKDNEHWLDNFALFMSLKQTFNLKPWNEWDNKYKIRDNKALGKWREDHSKEILFHKFVQSIFFHQWEELKTYVNSKNIKIIGDIPLFVAFDSADVWSHPDYFMVDKEGNPEYVAGVPPDYFSINGQRWGNPLYNWEIHQKEDFSWWIARINQCFKQVDILRIDHFRGFEAFWKIPASKKTAINGEWVKGPGINLFIALNNKLGKLPIIAEDLGIITQEVKELLKLTGFPGMRVLQFAFGNKISGKENQYLPHNYDSHTVVYPATHDNQCTISWYEVIDKSTKSHFLEYTNSTEEDVVGDMIRLAWSSVAKYSIISMQDLLRLDHKARMNYPGIPDGNWQWRYTENQITEDHIKELSKLNNLYGR